jgi:hypothetical protein
MQRIVLAALLGIASHQTLAADVGVSIRVGEPGFYGQIDIGNVPRPVIINPRPVIVERVRVVPAEPLYIVAPPGHIKHWEKHCHEYHACGRPVYFVEERWYREVYVPQYQEHAGRGPDVDDRGPGKGHGHGKGHGKGH